MTAFVMVYRKRDVNKINQLVKTISAKGEDVVHTPGAILTRLTVGGITNALAGVEGGIVDVTTCRLLAPKAEGGGAESKDAKKKAAADATSPEINAKTTGTAAESGIILAAVQSTAITKNPRRKCENCGSGRYPR